MTKPERKLESKQGASGAERTGGAVKESEWNAALMAMLRGLNQREAAAVSGLGESTVRRLMREGYPKQVWGQTPLRIRLEQERTKIRAMRANMTADAPVPPKTPTTPAEAQVLHDVTTAVRPSEQQAAKNDAFEARSAEAAMVKVARGNVLVLLQASLALAGPAAQLATAIGKRVTRDIAQAEAGVLRDKATGLEMGGVDAMKSLHLLRMTSVTFKSIVETGAKAMEMERLLLGDPSGTGKLAENAAAMSDEDMMIELNNMAKIWGSLERKGLRLIQGGRGVEDASPAPAKPASSPTPEPPAAPSSGSEG